ncbi:MAG: beta-lactamase family protein [Planctomycetaceae bacterium]|jgi:CubicO group peptidase (beta-lactamase class C family)|nr:beta-lactamase family protein [Planctomycetaceae bacterium]
MKHTFRILAFFCLLFFVSTLSAQNAPIKELLQPYIDSSELPGIVTVIATKDKVLQIDAVGYADLETKQPMTPNTVFWMASQTKPVTAIAVMILVEEGKLSLDEPAVKYLPELKNLRVIAEQNEKQTVLVPPDKPITLRMLLSHTAGMVFITLFQQKYGIDSLPTNRALTTFIMTPLAHQPGTKYLYSNVGIDIAATIVERVSGMPFETFLEKRLFEPLGMKETSFWPTAEQIKRLAKPYRLDKESKKLVETKIFYLTYPNDDRVNRFPEGGGGLFSTPAEWVRIYQMFAGEGTFDGKKILSPESVKEIRTKQTGDLPNNYGLGTNIGGSVFGHGGSHGTDSKLDINTGRIVQYFIQQEGLPKAGEAQGAFMKAALAL